MSPAAGAAAGARVPGRIGAAFAAARAAGRPALIPFVMAGDPDLDTTRRVVAALGRGGASLVEIGVPFSDPIADGPVIQRAAGRALRNGVTLDAVLDLATGLRAAGAPPIVLFTYFNPIHRMGIGAFVRRAGPCVDGVLVTDLPPEEGAELDAALRAARVDLIRLVAPTTPPARMAGIARAAGGFLYVIARTGVTGARADLPEGLPALLGAARAAAPGLPIAAGFGIGRPDQVRALAAHADGVVVGSALVELMESARGSPDLTARVEAFCRTLMSP